MLARVVLRQAGRRAAVRSLVNGSATALVNQTQLPIVAAARGFASAKEDDNSHSDFAPKYHAAPSTEKDDILKMIDSHVKTYPVMLYMKGTPSAPQCGFSMQVVRILHAEGVSFDSVNILDHPEIREGVKEYS